MAVIIGSARIDERGQASGGKAGDQTGKEVASENWYLHNKGWVVLRAKSDTDRINIAYAMIAAVNNPNIGYDQNQRLTLYDAVKTKGYNPGLCTVPVETDCSALVRVCVCYAGIIVGNFNTANEKSVLAATGKFDVLTDSKYTKSSDYLRTGDILVTASKGHTVIVLNDGAKVSPASQPVPQAKPVQQTTTATQTTTNTTTTSEPVYYTVKAGDTMSKIAKKYNTTLAKLKALNPNIKNVNKIYVGQKIRVK